MELEKIALRKNRIKKAKRLGRGYGSGVGGHTVGRGTKGQKSRSGHKSLQFFEGGNVPFFRRMPKYKGFNNKFGWGTSPRWRYGWAITCRTASNTF